MPQITLTVPQEKIPVLNNALKQLGIKISSAKSFITKELYQADVTNSIENYATSQKYFSWDNNRNELEFE